MHDAGAGNDDAVEQILLLIAARFHAWRAGPQNAAALLEVGDKAGKGIKRRHLGQRLAIAADEIDSGAGEKDENFEAGGDAAIGDGKRDRG